MSSPNGMFPQPATQDTDGQGDLPIFERELNALLRRHGLGIGGEAVLFVLEREDFSFDHVVDNESRIVFGGRREPAVGLAETSEQDWASIEQMLSERLGETERSPAPSTGKHFSAADWFSLPVAFRHEWWEETNYGTLAPSEALLMRARALLASRP